MTSATTGIGLSAGDILDIASYESVRDQYRPRILAHKGERRIEVGELVSLTFEDRETVRYQIQEMARVERLVDPARLAHEIEVYGELLPTSDELTATLFIQIPDMTLIRSELDRLLGIDECVVLEIASGAGNRNGGPWTVRAEFDQRQLDADRISAVHYLRFRLPADAREGFVAGAPARVRIDHAAYSHTVELPEATRASLIRDLTGATPELLDPSEVAANAPRDRVVSERDGIRIVEPGIKARLHHFVVEASDPAESLTTCDAERLAGLFAAARDLARDLSERGIASQIVANVEAGGGDAARLVVVSVDS